MRRLTLCLLLLALLVPPAKAQTIQALTSLGYAQMTSLGSAASLPSIPSGTAEALILCTGATVYWRDDGTAPTATVGMPLLVNQPLPYIGSLVKLQIIQASATAVCNVTYYGY